MIVHMSRKHRRILQKRVGFRVRGSDDALRSALTYAQEYVELAQEELMCSGDSNFGEADEFLTRANETLWDLLVAHTPRRRGEPLLRRGPVQEPVWAPAEEPDSSLATAYAVQVATKLVGAGESEKVRAALAAVGRVRVNALPEGDVPAFLAALAP